MSNDVAELPADDRAFLEPFLPPQPSGDQPPAHPSSSADRPFVTLTYASSLDSMVALAPGARTTLSGVETKRMTHYLRLRHDAILVGAGTAVVDDPSLNCRYPGATRVQQPRPVIVDPNARWDWGPTKVVTLAAEGRGKGPWIVSRPGTRTDQRLLDVGGEYLVVEHEERQGEGGQGTGSMPWAEILRTLKRRGVDSVMIEGGARVINTLLREPDLIDAVIVTIAPTWLGRGGVEVQPATKTVNGGRVNSAWLQGTSWRQFGDDVVLCGRLSETKS